jgi:hypothetical protein
MGLPMPNHGQIAGELQALVAVVDDVTTAIARWGGAEFR